MAPVGGKFFGWLLGQLGLNFCTSNKSGLTKRTGETPGDMEQVGKICDDNQS